MLRILVVDDNGTKLQKVLSAILEVEGTTRDLVVTAHDAASAKRHLRAEQFDLLVLDIMIPDTEDLAPRGDGGIRLLRELYDRPTVYKLPQHIVAITAYDEAFSLAVPAFASELWYTLKYDEISDEWRASLQKRVRYALFAERSYRATAAHDCDLAIVTALYDPELSAVLRLPWGWERAATDNDVTEYHVGAYVCPSGQRRRVIAAAAPRMGMPAAAALTAKMIERFHPRYIAMTGITAGVRGKAELGDVVIAEFAWDWGSGKLHKEGGEPGFSPAPHQLAPDPRLLAQLRAFSRDDAVLQDIRRQWPSPPTSALRAHVGPIASGAAVVADSGVTAALARFDRKVVGIEMESYGFFAASREGTFPSPAAFCMKSVCDFADEKKDDRYQAYAAYTSAASLRGFAERYLRVG